MLDATLFLESNATVDLWLTVEGDDLLSLSTSFELTSSVPEIELLLANIAVLPQFVDISLGELNNVNTTSLANGYLLVYDATTQKWISKATENIIIDGGSF